MKPSNNYQSCGYGSCPCRGVNFISCGMGSTDYCVDGKRVRVLEGAPLPARIFVYQLDKYAAFLTWHAENRRAGKILDRAPEPFNYTREVTA